MLIKHACLLLTIIIMLSVSVSYGEVLSIDLENASVEELLDFRDRIDEKLSNKELTEVYTASGLFYVHSKSSPALCFFDSEQLGQHRTICRI